MKQSKQALSLLFIALILSGTACTDNTDTAAKPTDAETAVKIEDPAAFVPDDVFYKDKTFRVLYASGYDHLTNEIAPLKDEYESGDIIAESVVGPEDLQHVQLRLRRTGLRVLHDRRYQLL